MYIVEFYKNDRCEDCGGPEEYKILVFDKSELMQLLNYLSEFEYELKSVVEDFLFVGLDTFKEFIKDTQEMKKEKK
jgi:hypothetical protein